MNVLTKSKKYTGVYYRKKDNGDLSYYFLYRNSNKKNVFHKVGLKSQGISEQYVSELRSETILELKNGELPKILRSSKLHKITFSEISDYYFDNRITRSNERRRQLYLVRLKPEFGDMNIYQIKPSHILNFRNKLVGILQPHTINLYIELMSTIFNYFSKHRNIKIENPTLKVDKLKVNNTRKRILTLSEIELLFEELKDDFMLKLFCSLCLCTGGRKSTVLNYKIKDINLEHRTINSFDFKNQSSYISFIDDRTYELLKLRLLSVYDINPNTQLVYVDGVKDLTRWINRQLKIIFDTLFNFGLEPTDSQNRVVVHTFRHTLLSHLGMKGINSQLLQKISNHKDSSMVDRYVKLDENTGRKEIIDVWKKKDL
ncbi:MAG: site-specific integrase [Aliarcobacter sp.]|nr:site-specific integrase [Aliarcobacter sp.]